MTLLHLHRDDITMKLKYLKYLGSGPNPQISGLKFRNLKAQIQKMEVWPGIKPGVKYR